MNAPPPTRRFGLVLPLVLAGLAIGAGNLLSKRIGRAPGVAPSGSTTTAAHAAAAAGLPADDSGVFQVARATGLVEAQRDGRWIPIKNGDTLTRADVVRTAAGAGAILKLSAGTEIELRERVEIGLDRLPSGPTVDLRRGKVLARVSGSDALAITSHQTRTANEGPARFVVLSDPQGRVSVATLSGAARFAAGGKEVSVAAGTQSSSLGGAAPTDPERIPEEIFLEVVWPAAEQRHTVDHTEIRGRATPSSAVRVNGTPAPVGADGQFTTGLPLHEGKNPVQVEVEDLTGRTRRASGTVVRRGLPQPALTPEPTELWKK